MIVFPSYRIFYSWFDKQSAIYNVALIGNAAATIVPIQAPTTELPKIQNDTSMKLFPSLMLSCPHTAPLITAPINAPTRTKPS